MSIKTMYSLLFETGKKRAYLSFPMSHVLDLPGTMAEIERFKADIASHFVCFDPGEVDEFALHTMAARRRWRKDTR